MAKVEDAKVWTGTEWASLKGPTVVSANADNLATLGTDGYIYVNQGTLDLRYVNVAGDTMTGPLQLPDGTAAIPSLKFDDATGIFQSAPNQLAFSTNGIQRLTIGANGDTGIGTGTTAPAAVLDLRRSAAGTGPALIMGRLATGVTNGSGQTVAVAASTTGGNASGVAFTHTSNDGTASANRNVLRFSDAQVRIETGANAPVLLVDTVNSRVGIGNPSPTPTEVLDVVGNAKISGTVTSATVIATNLRLPTARTPASQTATSQIGEVCWDSSYFYVSTGNNLWRRIPLEGWSGTIIGPLVPGGVDASVGSPLTLQGFVGVQSNAYPGRARITWPEVSSPVNALKGHVVEYMAVDATQWVRAQNVVWIDPATYTDSSPTVVNDPLARAAILLDLIPGVRYFIRVAGFTDIGIGAFRTLTNPSVGLTPVSYYDQFSVPSTALGPLEFTNQTGTSDTLGLSDLGRVVVNASTTGDHTLFIPADATANFPIGSVLELVDNSPNNTIIKANAGVTLRYDYIDKTTGSHTLGGGAAATAYLNGRLCAARLVKAAPNLWWLFGDVTPTPTAKMGAALDP